MFMLLGERENIRMKILSAIMEDPEIVLYLKEKYVDEEIWKYCIEREPSLFKKMKHPSEEICMFACEVDGANLKHVKTKFRYIPITSVMIINSVKSNPKALLSVPKKFLTNEIKEIAFDEDPSLMTYFDDVRPNYLVKLLEEKPWAIQYVTDPDESLICDEIKRSPNICPYLNHMTKNMMETLRIYHPNYYTLYQNSNSYQTPTSN